MDQLAVTLRQSALRRGDTDQLARAVALHRGVPSGATEHAERAALLGHLGGTLQAWATRGVGHDALEDALRAYRQAVAVTPPTDAAYPAALTNLGNGWSTATTPAGVRIR
jgi:hypothetical protein